MAKAGGWALPVDGVSIVVPVFNEGENVVELTGRLNAVFAGRAEPCEIVFADDSTDETTALLAALAGAPGRCRVRVLHREERGLATAVALGIRAAAYPRIVVMDADLQHPPEVVPQLLDALDAGADLAAAGRFVPGGGAQMSPLRTRTSRACSRFATLLLPALRPLCDVTSGFFAFRREIVDGVELRPLGWKILIEILARGRAARVVEIPYVFAARVRGASTLSAREALLFVRHLLRLRRETGGKHVRG